MAVDFGKTAGDYARHRAGFPDEFFDRLQAMGIGIAGQRVLDIGTGTGTLARGFARRGCRVIGLDPSVELIDEARRLDAIDHVSSEYRVGVAERTELPDDSIDVVSAGQCWHWLDRPKAALEMLRILAPEGSLVICHLDWPPIPRTVSEATKALIRKHNPAWDVAIPGGNPGSTGIYPQWTTDLAEAGFVGLETFSFDIAIPYTREAWRGRIRASGNVAASLPPEAVERLDDELNELLSSRFPEEPLMILHRVWALVGRPPRLPQE